MSGLFTHAKQTTKRIITFSGSAILAMASMAPLILSGSALAATTAVTPTSLNGWYTEDGAPSFVAGPSGADGNGSLKFATTTSSSKQNFMHQTADTPLSSVAGLGYKLDDTAGIPASYQLYVTGLNRLDSAASDWSYLVWEPVYNGQPNGPNGGFVGESNLETGTWWSSKPIAGAADRNTFVPLSAILAANPNATVKAFGVNVGSGTPNATSYVDDISFGSATYNFDVDPLATPSNLTPANDTYTKDVNFSNTWKSVSGASDYEYRTANMLNTDGTLGPIIYQDSSSTNPDHYDLSGSTVVRTNNGTPENTYYWQVRAVSSDGNYSAWSAINKVTVDKTSPIVSFVSPAVGATVSGTTPISLSITETNQSYTYIEVNQNGAWKAATTLGGNTPNWNFDTTTLPDGNYTIKVDAVDKAGNGVEVTRNITIGNPPTIDAITANGAPLDNGNKVNGTTTFEVTSHDANPSYTYIELNKNGVWLSDNSKTTGSSMSGTDAKFVLNTTDYADGNYTLKIDVVDQKGNTTERFINFVIGNPPTITSVTPADGSTIQGTTTFTVQAADNNASYIYVELNRDGVWITDNTKSGTMSDVLSTLTYDTTRLENGVYTLKVDAVDQAGNTTEHLYNYTVNNQPAASSNDGSDANTGDNNTGNSPTGDSTTNQVTLTSFSLTTSVPTPLTARRTGTVATNTSTPSNTSNSAVLGDSTTAPSNTDTKSAVKGLSTTTKKDDKASNSAAFLGLGWWWIVVVAAILFLLLAIWRSRSNEQQA